MPENRFFLDCPLHLDETIELEGEEAHHAKVMRRVVGDTIEVVNGRGDLAIGEIVAITKQKISLFLREIPISNLPPFPLLILAQALLKPKSLELIIEKGTELGATHFWLYPGEKSEKRELSDNQLHRFRQLTISALKQSGRLHLPSIEIHAPLKKWRDLPPEVESCAFFGDPKTTHSLPSRATLIFIGPESGWTKEEEKILSRQLKAKGVRLSSHILRAETAALCALAQARHGS